MIPFQFLFDKSRMVFEIRLRDNGCALEKEGGAGRVGSSQK